MTAEQFIKSKNFSLEVDSVIYLCREYARVKCLEAIKNTRYAAIDIVCQDEITGTVHVIQNIRNEDVLPEL